MAVWGTPTATEDDAERAVRAALDLVAAVSALGPGGRRREPARPRRRADRRGGGDARRPGRGDGRGRSRQHGLAGPVGGRAGDGVRRRGDAPRHRADDRLRGRRLVRAEGQGRTDAALAGAAGRLRRCAARSSRTVSRRRSSAATASCARSRICSTPAPRSRRRIWCRSPGSPGSASRASRWEFYKYFDGIAETRLLAPRPLSLLRRGRHLLGARRHGADALPDRRGRGAGVGAREAARDPRGARSSTRTSAASSSRGSRTCSGSAEHQARDQQDLFAAWRLFFERLAEGVPDRARCSRTCSGRTRACSTSSSTCSTGRAAHRSS